MGSKYQQVYSFKDIFYAQAQRYQEPQSVSWAGVINVLTYGEVRPDGAETVNVHEFAISGPGPLRLHRQPFRKRLAVARLHHERTIDDTSCGLHAAPAPSLRSILAMTAALTAALATPAVMLRVLNRVVDYRKVSRSVDRTA